MNVGKEPKLRPSSFLYFSFLRMMEFADHASSFCLFSVIHLLKYLAVKFKKKLLGLNFYILFLNEHTSLLLCENVLKFCVSE